jgi:hypothetical protein
VTGPLPVRPGKRRCEQVFSHSNVFRMRAFYEAYASVLTSPTHVVPESAGKKVARAVRQSDGLRLPDVLARMPWGHNIVLLQELTFRMVSVAG